MVCITCIHAETEECMSSAQFYGMLEFKLCCEILLLLNRADMDRL